MGSDRRLVVIVAAALAAIAIWVWALWPGQALLSVTFLDVGDGLCAVVRSPAGRTLVVDCGTSSWRRSESVGRKLVAPYLQSLGLDRIDAVILTHPHSDHVSGLGGLLAEKPAELVLDIGMGQPSSCYHQFLGAVKRTGARYKLLKRGQSLDLGGGAVVEVLSPDPGCESDEINEASAVLRITHKRAAILLAADAGTELEREIIDSGASLRAQVLQVGHHGSASSTSPEWLAAVRPGVAVISCSSRSPYGHPSRDVVRRLRAFGARVYVTANDGAVTVTTDGTRIEVKTHRRTW